MQVVRPARASRPTAARRPPARGGRAGPTSCAAASRANPSVPDLGRRTRTGSRRGTPAPAGARGRAATPARPTRAGRRPGRSPGCRRTSSSRSTRTGRSPSQTTLSGSASPCTRTRPSTGHEARSAAGHAGDGAGGGPPVAQQRGADVVERAPAPRPTGAPAPTPRSSGATARPGTRSCAVAHHRCAVPLQRRRSRPPSGAASGRTTGAPDAVQPGGPGGDLVGALARARTVRQHPQHRGVGDEHVRRAGAPERRPGQAERGGRGVAERAAALRRRGRRPPGPAARRAARPDPGGPGTRPATTFPSARPAGP